MKKYLFMLTAVLFAAVSYAMIASGDREERVPDSQSEVLQGVKSLRSIGIKQGQVANSSVFGPRKVQGDHDAIITEVPPTAEVKYYTRSGYYHQSSNNYSVAEQSGLTAIAYDGDDVYIQNPIAGFETYTWVKGTLSGETITVPLGQFLTWNENYGYGLYITMVDVDGTDYTNDTAATEITYTISDNTITQNGTSAERTLAVAWSDDDTAYSYGSPGGEYETVFTLDTDYVPPTTVLVELPDGATVEQWYAVGTNNGDEANVAFVGDEVYISGIFGDFPDSWIKGTISGSTVTFEKMQYLGEYSTYHIWAVAANMDSGDLEDIVMAYDAEAGTLTLDESQALVANAKEDDLYYLSIFYSLKLMKDAPAPLVIDELPYTNGFDTEAEWADFKVIDANRDGYTWAQYSKTARLVYSNIDDDDWLVSPLLKLEAGKTYKVSLQARCQSTSYPETFEVRAAKEQNVDALTAGLEVIPTTTVSSTSFTNYENAGFTVPEDGYYCIGIHGITTYDDAYYLYVDDFAVEDVTSEDVPDENKTCYVKVTDTDDITDGEYLIVYEGDETHDAMAFNGNLSTLDHVKNGEKVVIADGKIFATGQLDPDSITFTIDLTAGTLKSHSGDYIGVTSNSNGLKQSSNAAAYTNAFSIAEGGSASIMADYEGSTMSLRYNYANDQQRFRYYKNASQQPIALYKKVESAIEPEPQLDSYTYSFIQAMNGWTTIDADEDGNTWYILINDDILGQNGKPGLVTSASWANNTALFPDNYLVSPKMKLDGKITFYANAQDASWPAEHFGVAVSTASGTDAADFQMVTEEWEMAATRRTQGNWYFYEVDLSSFAGVEGYVAIRHYNCSDKFRLNVDNITLETSQLIDAYDPELEKEPAGPSVVVLPDGAEVFEYNMAYTNPSDGEEASKPINVAVVGNEVYFQGMSYYLPEAWVKGTLEGNQVTFAAKQLMGTYGAYGESYFFYNGETVFTYDADADTYSATGEIYGVLGEKYYDGRYKDPVLSRVTEVAGVPATPSISGIEESNYGDIVNFNIPLQDIDGNNMVVSKLSYQFFVDDETTPLEFTTEYFSRLTENMTVIPYGFTDNYDIYDTYIYLNMPHDTWVRLGIQSIYTGGGEENKSEIFWFDMPVTELPVEAPTDLATETYVFKAFAKEYNSSGDIELPDYALQVQVGFDGDDVYVQGLSKDAPDLWVKGTKNGEGKYVIPANQYMGELSFYGYTFPYYWTALDAENNFVDAVLSFDAETSTFTTDQTLALNGDPKVLDYYLLFDDVIITKFVEVAATPATPTFESFNLSESVGYTTIYASIPAVDTEGNDLDQNKLFYTVWYEKDGVQQPYTFTAELYPSDFDEDVTEVPYTYDGYDIYSGGQIIYLEDELEELKSWTMVGIQSIYYGAGERRESSVAWLNLSETTGISELNTAAAQTGTIYNLSGQKVQKAQKGLYIINGRKMVVK